MLVNGSQLDLFENQILQPLLKYIQENEQGISQMNMQIWHALCAALTPESANNNQLQHSKTSQEPVSKTVSSNQTPGPNKTLAIMPKNPVTTNSPQPVDTSSYLCPACEKSSGL